MNQKIILVAGDPNSINSEIIYKVWKKLNKLIKKKLYIIGSYNLINDQFKKINIKNKLIKVNNLENINRIDLKIIDVPLKFKNSFKVPTNNSSKYVLECLKVAHKLSIEKKVKGMINCPIDKKLLKKTGKIGVTELLANKCNIKNNTEVMMIHNKNLSVVPLTTHIDIKKISAQIKKKLIIKKIKTLNQDFTKLFKKKPRIAILGLNPHNAELKKNSEEVKQIIPAISFLKKQNINVHGPLVSDTIFINKYKQFDVIIGIYHDQVLTPFKALFRFNAINITLGLNYTRVSPDHGTAIDLIKKNKADCSSLFECVKFINNLD